MTAKTKNMLLRAVTGVLFLAIMITGLLHAQTIVLLFALIAALTLWEYTGLVNQREDVQVNRVISTVAGVYLVIAVASWRTGQTATFAVFAPYLFTIIYLLVSGLYTRTANPINDWAHALFGQMYIALPLSLISILAFEQNAEGGMVNFDGILPLTVFVCLWASDTGAYITGTLVGRHKLFPRISPAKTWEGSIGGTLLAILAAGLMGTLTESVTSDVLTLPQWLGLGLVVAVTGTWGDLVESLFKRTLGVKDSGHLLPGHGGLLDRFDSSLLAIPSSVVYLYSLSLF